MNELLRKLLGPYMDEIEADGGAGAGGAPAAAGGGAPAADEGGGTDGAGEELETVDGVKVDAGDEPKKPEVPIEKQMLSGIEKALKKPDAAPGEDGKPTVAAKPGETPADPKKPAAAKDELKGKSSEDFKLTPELEAVLKPEAKKRFSGLISLAKQHEDTIVQQSTAIEGLTKARDTIMSVLEESQCTAADLGPMLEFNLAIKTGKWDYALAATDAMRKQILTRMGKEAPGVDLLDGFPDLAQQVQDEQITRQAAIELASGRRRETERSTVARNREETTRQHGQVQERREGALGAIEKWSQTLAGKDIDYKAKEARFLAADPTTGKTRLDSIMARLWDRPEEWLAALQDVYGAIEVVKQPAAPGPQPLRPSGARGGNREPSSIADGIASSLGYNLETMK